VASEPDTGTGNNENPVRKRRVWEFFGQPVDDPLVDIARRNPAIAASFLGAILILTKAFAATSWCPTQAIALLSASDFGSILTGIAATTVPLLLPTIAILLNYWSRAYYAAKRRAAVTEVVIAFVVIGAFYLTPWLIVVATLIGLYWARRTAGWWQRRVGAGTVRKGLAPVDEALVTAAILVNFLTIPTIWLPAESIQIGSDPATTAYVVRASGDWTTLLRDKDRVVVNVRTDSLSRQSCEVPSSLGVSIARLLRSDPALPVCP
jgi:hypothetical protein